MAMGISDDKYKIDEAKKYLNRMDRATEAYNPEFEMNSQGGVVKK